MDEARNGCNLVALVDEYYESLYRFAYRLSGSEADALDLTQQTFLAAQRKLDQLRDPSCAKAWLFRIVRNTFLKSLRRKLLESQVSLEAVTEPTGQIPDDVYVNREEIQQYLDELPEEFRTVLILFYFQEFSYKEIAEQLDVPLGTVMSRLARGKSHLRQRFARLPTGV